MTALIGSGLDYFADLEVSLGLQTLFKLRSQRQASEQIVIVAMDEASETELGLGQDLPAWRGHHARLIQQLTTQKAALVVFDLQFIKANTSEDPALVRAIRAAGNVLVSECVQKFRYGNEDFFGREECSESNKQPVVNLEYQSSASTVVSEQLVVMRKIPPYPLLAEAVADHAAFHLIKDAAGTPTREGWLYFDGLAEAPSLPLVIWLHALLQNQTAISFIAENQKPSNWLTEQRRACLANPNSYVLDAPLVAEQRQQLRQIVCGGNTRYLDFYGPPKSFRMESYSDVYLGKVANLAGKIILVGKASRQFNSSHIDTFQTPFSDTRTGKMSGVEIMATQLANLMENRQIKMPLPASLLFFGFALLMAMILTSAKAGWGVALSILMTTGYVAVAVWRFSLDGLWLPVAVPVLLQLPLSWLLAAVWARRDWLAERNRLLLFVRKVFPQWDTFSPESVSNWRADSRSATIVSERNINGICLATDIESYTQIATHRSPHEMWVLLNAYYQVLGEPVNNHDGLIADVTGDSMMAIWLDDSLENRRLASCLAALDMAMAVQRFNDNSAVDPMNTRIGLFEGEMTLGGLDTGNSSHFRAIGDTVNTASRIQGVNKILGTQILACKAIVESSNDLYWRALGQFQVVGRDMPIELVELVGRKDEISAKTKAYCQQFSENLQAFQYGHWQQAADGFRRLLLEQPSDGPSHFYLSLALNYAENPQQPWDGVVVLAQK